MQNVYLGHLDSERVRVRYDAKAREHFVTASDARTMVNPTDWGLHTTTNDTVVPMLLYIPRYNVAPD
jgi:hypothetical protein